MLAIAFGVEESGDAIGFTAGESPSEFAQA